MTKMRYGLAPVVNAMSFIWVKDLIVLSGICCPLLMMHSPHFCARRLTSGQKIDRPIKALYPALPSAPLPPLPPKWRGAELGVCHVSQEAWLRDVSVDVSGCALTANSLSRVRTLICGRGLIDWALHLMTQMHSGRPDFLSPLPLPSVSVFPRLFKHAPLYWFCSPSFSSPIRPCHLHPGGSAEPDRIHYLVSRSWGLSERTWVILAQKKACWFLLVLLLPIVLLTWLFFSLSLSPCWTPSLFQPLLWWSRQPSYWSDCSGSYHPLMYYLYWMPYFSFMLLH